MKDIRTFVMGAKSPLGGGTANYEALTNKPSINGVTLSGDKAAADLGLVREVTGKQLSTNDFTNAYKATLDNAVTGVKGNEESAYRTGNVNITPANIGAVPVSSVGTANGVAELDANGKVLSSQLPSYVDDVLEYASVSAFPTTGESGKIYVSTDTNLSYRWTGSGYVEISPSLALGETSSTAYRGDRGKTAYDHAQTTGNAHSMTKADIGLGNVDNTSDANKPVSTAQQAALDGKVDKISGKGLSTNDYTDADKAKLSALQSLIRRMEIYCTASGNPATFSDAKAANVKDLTATIVPTQEGEGDPYPPGGGKNKLFIEDYDFSLYSGIQHECINGVVTVFGTATRALSIGLTTNVNSLPAGNYTIINSGTLDEWWFLYNNTTGSDLASKSTPTFTYNGTDNIVLKWGPVPADKAVNGTYKFMLISEGETDTSYAPYSNVRPISGVSSVSVTRTGENGANPQTVTVQLTAGSNPLTVYGGTLDVTKGELVVNRKRVLISSQTWNIREVYNVAHFVSFTDNPVSNDGICSCYPAYASVWQSRTHDYGIVIGSNEWGNTTLYTAIRDSRYATAADFKAAMGDQSYVIPIAPVTYQLTPQQLATLAGYNTVSTDAGTLSVTYKANPALSLGGGA